MVIPAKKLKNVFAMPVFGIGTWRMGGVLEADNSRDREEIKALNTALDSGITHLDTAELYGHGHAEELIAQAIKGRDRSKLFIVSKVYSNHLKYRDVLEACHNSLKRLATEYLDLYLIHAPDSAVPIEDTLKALDELKAGGLIRNIGVSNFNIEQLKAAQRSTKNRIVNNQLHYSLAYRTWEDTVDYCQKNDILVTAYRPVERGVLTEPGIDILDEMCQKYSKTPAQVAINWLISQPNVVTISKMVGAEHMKENLGALGWKMAEADIERLRHEFPETELPKGLIRFKN